jgi:hypothetical protein
MDEVLTPDSSRFWPADKYEPGRNPPSYDKQGVRDWLESTTVDGGPGTRRSRRRRCLPTVSRGSGGCISTAVAVQLGASAVTRPSAPSPGCG